MLTERELDVLEILWKKEEPLMATDIVNSGEGGLTQSTVTAVLRKLLRNELVEVRGVTHSGKVLSRVYRPTEKAKDAVIEHIMEIYAPIKDFVSLDEVKKKVEAMQ